MSTGDKSTSDATLDDISNTIRAAQKEAVNQNLLWIQWMGGKKRFLPFTIISIGFSVVVIGVAFAYSSAELPPSVLSVVVILLGILIAFIGTIFRFSYNASMRQARGDFEELRSNDDATERARLKIQYYMHENLRQVHWIFWLSLVAMFLGFLIIIMGAVLALDPWKVGNSLPASIVTTLSGVIVEFISATFLFMYRSTMKQANEYVDILRRLNTIGIATDLIKNIDEKSSTRAHIASQILTAQLGQKEGEREQQPPA